MSRHIVRTTHQHRPIEVVAGWDRPLQEFFLTIQFLDTSPTEELEFLYSNLDEPSSRDLDYYQAVIARHQILVPDLFWPSIQDDQRLNRGTWIAIYDDHGTPHITAH